jgi:sugar phosphate isomerase/epimerase
MKLSVTTTTPDVPRPSPVALLAGPFPARVATAAALGLDGLELMVLDPAQIDARAIRAALNEAGLEVSAIASGAQAFQAGLTLLATDVDVRAAARARLHALIDLAAELGVPIVTVGSFRGRVAGQPDAPQLLADALGAAADHAAPRGVRLVLEPLNRYEADFLFTVAETLDFIAAVGHSHLGLLFDTYHANIEEPSFAGALQAAWDAGRLWHVHVSDSNRLAPGQGHVPFAAIVATLRDLGYTGYLSAEHFPHPDPAAAARAFSAHMRTLVPSANPQPLPGRVQTNAASQGAPAPFPEEDKPGKTGVRP